jgi:hypothetical protein
MTERVMSEQLRLFEPHRAKWIERVWGAIPNNVREQIVTTLAEMGRAAASSELEKPATQEADNDQ